MRPCRLPLVWLIAGSSLSALLLGFLIVAAAYAMGACPSPVVESEVPEASAILDAEHPVVDQVVRLTLRADALPADMEAGAARLLVRLDYPTRPELPAAPTPARRGADPPTNPRPEPHLSEVMVNVIDPVSGAAIGRSGLPETTINDSYRGDHPGIALDCPPQQACERSYLVRIALRDPLAVDPLPITWTTAVSLDYSRLQPVPCVPPVSAVPISAGQPTLVSAAARRDATIAPHLEDGLTVARHVTLETGGSLPRSDAGGSAQNGQSVVGRVSVRGTDWPDADWRMWVRVIPDSGTVPVAEGLIGRLWERPHDGLVDVPLLTDCASGNPCTRGYWLVMQAIPGLSVFPLEGPPNIGRFTWRMDVMAVGTDGAVPRSLSVRVDDLALDSSAVTRVEGANGSLHVGTLDRDRIVPLSIRLPVGSVSADHRIAGHVIAEMSADVSGGYLAYRWAGEAIGPSSAAGTSSLGSSTVGLIAHPLDPCPSGTCDVQVRIRLSRAGGSVGPQADIDWSVTLVGFPVGTTVTAGEPIDSTPDPVPLDVPLLVGLLAPWAVIAAIAFLLARRARTRRRRLEL